MISHSFIEQIWYGKHWLSVVLLPLSWLYNGLMKIRYNIYSIGLLPKRSVNVPVIVVGNITVGGTGKTPLIIWLCHYLKQQGHRPGVISRGYGGRPARSPQQVRPDSHPGQVGDEPVLIAQRTRCPVAVSPNRYLAASELLLHTDCDVLLCDDGLQHLGLGRDLEIAVIDGDRRFGNGHCLPAGPLRESTGRLAKVDLVIATGKAGRNEFLMHYIYADLHAMNDQTIIGIETLKGTSVHAVTGIGNPGRFHAWLRSHNIKVIRHEFPDHHSFTKSELVFDDDLPVIMTEKDAVKCREFRLKNCWYVPINAGLSEAFNFRLNKILKDLFNGQETA